LNPKTILEKLSNHEPKGKPQKAMLPRITRLALRIAFNPEKVDLNNSKIKAPIAIILLARQDDYEQLWQKTCPYCGQKFRNTMGLKTHMRISKCGARLRKAIKNAYKLYKIVFNATTSGKTRKKIREKLLETIEKILG